MNPKTLELKEKITDILKDCCGCPLEHKIMDLIKQSNLALLERIEAKMKPVLDDISNAGTIFTRNGLEGSGREMHENIGYIKGIFHNLKKELEHPND